MVDSTIFWIFAVLAVGSALGAVLHRSIVYSALFLIGAFLSTAGFFLLNNADFLALAQIIIYAVGITIIMLFAIMFTGDRPVVDKAVSGATKLAYALIAAYVAALLLRTVSFPFSTRLPDPQYIELMRTQGSTSLLGEQLFSTYALPFELASVLLLVAMIGAIIIAKRSFVEHCPGDTHFAIDLTSRPTPEAEAAHRGQHDLGLENPRAAQQDGDTPEKQVAGVK